MEKIKKFFTENGYEIYESDNLITADSKFLHVAVVKRAEGKYLVRNAVRCYFNRWANSGIEFYACSSEEVVGYFSDKNKCIPDATKELIYDIVEESVWDNDDRKIGKMIGSLYSLLCSGR